MTKTNNKLAVAGIEKKELEACLAHFEKMANTYNWKPNTSASGRRYEEKKNSASWSFFVDGKPVIASVSVSCSCRNYYAYRKIMHGDNQIKMMVPFLKKCIASLEA